MFIGVGYNYRKSYLESLVLSGLWTMERAAPKRNAGGSQ